MHRCFLSRPSIFRRPCTCRFLSCSSFLRRSPQPLFRVSSSPLLCPSSSFLLSTFSCPIKCLLYRPYVNTSNNETSRPPKNLSYVCTLRMCVHVCMCIWILKSTYLHHFVSTLLWLFKSENRIFPKYLVMWNPWTTLVNSPEIYHIMDFLQTYIEESEPNLRHLGFIYPLLIENFFFTLIFGCHSLKNPLYKLIGHRFTYDIIYSRTLRHICVV